MASWKGFFGSGFFGSPSSAPPPPGSGPALSVSDNADGSGATATITGTSGAGVSVYTQPASGGAFALAGTRSGDGTLNLPQLGYAWAYAVDAGGIGNIVYYAATTGTDSCFVRCQQGVAALLQSQIYPPALGGVTPSVVAQKAANVGKSDLPAILVTLEGMGDKPSSKQFAWPNRVQYGYPVAVAVMAHSSAYDPTNLDVFMRWRELAELKLNTATLSGVPELYKADVESGPRVEALVKGKINTPDYMRFVSGFVVRCLVIRQRG